MIMKNKKFLFIIFLIIFLYVINLVSSLKIENFSPSPIQLIYGTKSFSFLIVEDLNQNTTNINASCNVNVGTCSVSCPRSLNANTNATCIGILTIPQYTHAGIYNGIVVVEGLTNFGLVSDNETFIIDIIETHDLTLNFSLDDMGKNDIQNSSVSIKNIGNIELSINLTSWIENEDGEIVNIENELNETSFILNPGETKIIKLKIKTEDTSAGNYYAFIKANAKNDQYGIEFNKTVSEEFKVRFMYCSKIGGDYLSIEIKNRNDFEGKKFGPLENFTIKIKINNENDEEHNVNIKAALVENEEIIDESEIEKEITIEEDSYIIITLNFMIPLLEEGDYDLYIKVYDEDNEDECVQEDSYIKIKRESNKVILKNILFDKQYYECGQVMTISGSIVNIGKNDEDLVKISYEDDLNNSIDTTFDLYVDEEKNFLFQPKIPLNASEGNHKAIIKIYYDYSETRNTFEKTNIYEYYFYIQGNCIKPMKNVNAIINIDDVLYLNNSYEGKIILINIGDIPTIYEISIEASWAEYNIDSRILQLNPKEEKTIRINIIPKEIGTKILTLKVKFDNQEKIFTKTLTVKEFEEESKYKKASWIDELIFEFKRRPWLFALVLISIIISVICLILIIILLTKKH